MLTFSHHSEEGLQCHVTERWLTDTLLPKLASWSEQNALKTSATSLMLVPIDEYNSTYSRLKASYGQHFVRVSFLMLFRFFAYTPSLTLFS